VAYNIYFKFNIEDNFLLLATIDDIQVVEFDHKPEMGLTACYAISAVDSVGNESDISPFFCIEDCPSYILPNAFTPNGDGSNDFFIPILNRFVSSVRFEVFNEWGQKVFETNDPEINWNGTNFQNLPLHDGVYYYTCEVFQTSAVQGEQSYDFLKGFIQILKSN
jgi:gliding motility-associated-like protein